MARRKPRDIMPALTVPELLDCLAGSCRFEVLASLADVTQSVSAIAEALKLDITDVSKCLKRLHTAALLEVNQEGLKRYYRHSKLVKSVICDDTLHLAAMTRHGEIITCHVYLPINGRQSERNTTLDIETLDLPSLAAAMNGKHRGEDRQSPNLEDIVGNGQPQKLRGRSETTSNGLHGL